MDKRDNADEQNEVEVNIFADEDLSDGAPAPSNAEIVVDFGDAAESIVEDIKSDSLYGLRNADDAEDLDPGEIATETVVNVDDVAHVTRERGEVSSAPELDELSESINITNEEEVSYEIEEDPELAAARSERSRRRLRRLLVFFIIILAALAAVMALFIWRNTTPPDVKLPDSDGLQTSAAGTNTTQFQTIEADQIPDLVTYFGMTPEQAAEASGNAISLDAESTPASDASLPQVTSTRNGWLVGGSGETLASITFGLNSQGQVNYVFASFDLDAFGVADAKFDELAASNVVAASILKGIGLDPALVDATQLTIVEVPQAVTARDSSGLEVAEFSGPTNIEGIPTTWKVTETYDHTAGVTLGDNSVIRSLSVDLR